MSETEHSQTLRKIWQIGVSNPKHSFDVSKIIKCSDFELSLPICKILLIFAYFRHECTGRCSNFKQLTMSF